MNTYKCAFPKCAVQAGIEGAAKTLERIGWQVTAKEGNGGGPLILCPIHVGSQPLFSSSELNAKKKGTGG